MVARPSVRLNFKPRSDPTAQVIGRLPEERGLGVSERIVQVSRRRNMSQKCAKRLRLCDAMS